jgi:hypothetical protein
VAGIEFGQGVAKIALSADPIPERTKIPLYALKIDFHLARFAL